MAVAGKELRSTGKRGRTLVTEPYSFLNARGKVNVEGPSVIPMGDWMFMFYAGAYNNDPQQIGVARSKDGIHWEKMSNKPFLANGDAGSWNYCESGHPHIFKSPQGKLICFIRETMILKNMVFIEYPDFWKGDKPYLEN